MKLVEQHIVKSNDPSYESLREIMSCSKRLYNTASYIIRQHYFRISGQKFTEDISDDDQHSYLNYYSVNRLLKESNNECYFSLPSNTSQEVLKLVDRNYRSFFALLQRYKEGKLKDKPNIPRYKKDGSLVEVVYNRMTFEQQRQFRSEGVMYLPKHKDLKFKIINYKTCSQIRFIPRTNYILMEVVYEKKEKELKMDNQRYLAIDCGIDNLATCSSNVFPSFIINGRPIKSVNQFCNKRVGELKSKLEKCNGGQKSSKRIQRVWSKRHFKIKDYFHKTSHFIVDVCVRHNINTIVIGKNKGWKAGVKLGKRNNQNFVSIPFDQLINMICYKAKLQGIDVVLQEESYTSKSSFFDNDPIPTYKTGDNKTPSFSGKRVKRGLYKTSTGLLINADVNGSLNILRKHLNVVSDRIIPVGHRGLVVRPLKFNL